MITLSTHAPTNRFRRLSWEARKARFSKALAEAAGLQTRSGTGRASSDAADPSSRPSGWEVFVQCVAGSTLAALFLLIAVVLMGFSEIASPEQPEPECRDQFTSDTRYVRHCNFHDGRGWIETKKDTK